MIKPTKLNVPYFHTHKGQKNDGSPYRGRTLIGEIQNCYISDTYNLVYKLNYNNKHLSDKKRLLIQKADAFNDLWINEGSYRDD